MKIRTNAKTDALHDFQVENKLTPLQCVEKAKDQCAVFYARYRDSNASVMSITEAAKEIGCPRHIISAMVQAGHAWSTFALFQTPRRAYKARIVNVDKCRDVLEKRTRPPRASSEPGDRPPANMFPISVLAKEMAMNPSTLFAWVKRHELRADLYVSETSSGRNAIQWHADRNEAHALLRAKLADVRYGKAMRCVLSTPVTPLISELWGLPLDPEPVS